MYRPRLFYLEWVEGRFTDNDDTRLGQRVHRRIDEEAGAAPLPEEDELRRARSGETVDVRELARLSWLA